MTNDLINKIDNFLKSKKYIKPEKGQKPPKGTQIKIGPREGKYYEEYQDLVPKELREKEAKLLAHPAKVPKRQPWICGKCKNESYSSFGPPVFCSKCGERKDFSQKSIFGGMRHKNAS